jgi:carbon storage regulator
MLILSRKVDESIVINDNITVKVVSVDKGVVKLGIDAPSEVMILRHELVKAVEASNKEASSHIDDTILNQFYKKFKK